MAAHIEGRKRRSESAFVGFGECVFVSFHVMLQFCTELSELKHPLLTHTELSLGNETFGCSRLMGGN